MTELNRAANALFPTEGSRVGNVKFFTLARQVDAERLAEQLNRADSQIELGNVQPVDDIDGDLSIPV